MTSVSTYGQHLRMQNLNLLIQERQSDLNEQVGSGKKTQLFGGLGADARISIDMRNHISELDTYQKNIDTAKLRVTSMGEAMERITSIAREVQVQLVKLSGNSEPNTKVLNDLARTGFQEVVDMLNAKVEGRYLFSGSDIDTAPVADPDKYLADIAAEVANYPLSTAATVQTNTHTIASSNSYYSAALGVPETSPLRARVDRDLDLDYTIRANGTETPAPAPAALPGFREIMRSLATAASLTYDPSSPTSFPEFTRMVETTRDNLKAAALDVESQTGILGNMRSRMDAIDERHENTLITLERRLGKVEDVDMAEAISKLQATQTQLEASYRVTASLRDISLVNYI